MKKFLLFAIVFLSTFTYLRNATNDYLKSVPETEQWDLAATDALATVYNAVASQCNDDFLHTASMYRIIPSRIPQQRIIAMERTFMAELGLSYGDIVRIEGTGKYDGEWQIQDTMNKRFKGLHKIDILVPESTKNGKWDNIKIYTPANNLAREGAKARLQKSLNS